MSDMSCLVIGAGISGLLAATEMQAAGIEVVVLDKGRGVGGRMASRRLPFGDGGMGRADHGAQYFTVRSERLRACVDAWLAAGVVQEWAQGFYDSAGDPHFNGVPRYVGVGGMTAVAKHLAQGLDVRTATRVARIDRGEQFSVTTDDGQVFESDLLLMTPPAEQTLALIDAGNVVLQAETRAALEGIAFNPCFAVMAVLDRLSAIPAPGGVWPKVGEPISWIADNQQKGVSSVPSVTIHAGAEFTRRHWDSDREVVGTLLMEEARPIIGDAEVLTMQVQRWKYSIPTALHSEACLIEGKLAFAGDAFEGARVEGAALSGLAAAGRLLNLSTE